MSELITREEYESYKPQINRRSGYDYPHYKHFDHGYKRSLEILDS